MTGEPFPELSVQSFAACEVGADARLIGAPIDADTIYLVLAGKLHLRLPTGDRVAGAGSLVLVPPGLQPGIAPAPVVSTEIAATRERLSQRGGLLVFDAAGGAPGALRVLVGRVRGGLSAKMHGGADEVVIEDLRGSALARTAFATLRAELDEPSPGFATLAGSLMEACLLLFVRAVREEVDAMRPATAAGQRIAAVAAAVRARPADGYSIDRLAKLAGMSRATFTRQFAQHIGTTPMDYVQAVRLRDAAGMLRATQLPIKQIAADAGFQNRSHFSRAFQARFGLDPSRFRAASADDGFISEHISLPLLQDRMPVGSLPLPHGSNSVAAEGDDNPKEINDFGGNPRLETSS